MDPNGNNAKFQMTLFHMILYQMDLEIYYSIPNKSKRQYAARFKSLL